VRIIGNHPFSVACALTMILVVALTTSCRERGEGSRNGESTSDAKPTNDERSLSIATFRADKLTDISVNSDERKWSGSRTLRPDDVAIGSFVSAAEWPADPQATRGKIHAPEEIPQLAFAAQMLELDVELGRDPNGAAYPCESLDLGRIGRLLPRLRTLRLRGCSGPVGALQPFAPSLEHLELVDITLDQARIRDLATLRQLKSLILARVRSAADVDLTRFHHAWPDLHELELSDLPRNSALTHFVRLTPKLRRLTVQGNWATPALLDDLQKTPNLEGLALAETSIGAPALKRLESFHQLRSLSLAQARKADFVFRALRNLKLTELIFECPELSAAGAAGLEGLQTLERVEWINTPVAISHLSALAELPHLKTLHFRATDVPALAFATLSKAPLLHDLEWLGGKLEDPMAPDLESMVQLERLVLHLENFGDAAALHLRPLTRLRELDLAHTRVSDPGLAALGNLAALEDVRLHHTRVSARGLAALANLNELRMLDLGHTDLVDSGLAALRPLPQLHTLRVDHTLITDRGLVFLKEFEQLAALNLASTVVSAKGIAHLHSLPRLKNVDLRGTRVDENGAQ
jgi:hypothetical protein